MASTPMIKTVNIKADIPIKNVDPPIYGVHKGIKMNPSNILKCLCRRAIVEEVLSDGSTVRLTTKNFREDFEGQLQARLAAEKAAAEEEIQKVKESYTGKIDDVDFLADLDDDDDDNDNGPEEAANVIVNREYFDGTTLETVGIASSIVDDEDNTEFTGVEEETDGEPESIEEEIEDEEDCEEADPTINTLTDAPNTTNVTRKNSSKHKKKKK